MPSTLICIGLYASQFPNTFSSAENANVWRTMYIRFWPWQLNVSFVLFCPFYGPWHPLGQWKKGEKERSECPVILTEQALSIKDLSFSKRFRFILKEARMIFLLPEPRKKAKCVCSTINPRQSFMFSLFCLSSADFCDSTTGIIEKLLTLLVHSGSQSDLRIRFSFLFPCYGEKEIISEMKIQLEGMVWKIFTMPKNTLKIR